MLMITKAIALWLLPPGILIMIAAIGLIAWRRWWGRGLVVTSLLLLLLLSLSPVRDGLMHPLEFHYPALDATQVRSGDVIVVLGGGVNRHAPEYGGRDFLSKPALMRAAFALSLAKKSGADVWVSGGAPLHDDQQAEGKIMRRWMIENGLAPTHIHAENGSNNTWQNAALLRPLLAASSVQRVLLVTTAWHMPRAVWSFDQVGIVVVPAPCDYSSPPRSYTLLDWLPDAATFSDSALALHEYLGLFYYRLRYGVNNRV